MGIFDFLRKGKEEKATPKPQVRPQQPSQQSGGQQSGGQHSGGLTDFNARKPGNDRGPVQTQPTAPATTLYEIKKGDTLSGIAKQQLGDASKWRTIYEANKDTIKDPDLIFPGQKIKIPK